MDDAFLHFSGHSEYACGPNRKDFTTMIDGHPIINVTHVLIIAQTGRKNIAYNSFWIHF